MIFDSSTAQKFKNNSALCSTFVNDGKPSPLDPRVEGPTPSPSPPPPPPPPPPTTTTTTTTLRRGSRSVDVATKSRALQPKGRATIMVGVGHNYSAKVRRRGGKSAAGAKPSTIDAQWTPTACGEDHVDGGGGCDDVCQTRINVLHHNFLICDALEGKGGHACERGTHPETLQSVGWPVGRSAKVRRRERTQGLHQHHWQS